MTHVPRQLPHPRAPLVDGDYVRPSPLGAAGYVLGEGQAGVIRFLRRGYKEARSLQGRGGSSHKETARGAQTPGAGVGQVLSLAHHKHELPHLILTQPKKWKSLEEEDQQEIQGSTLGDGRGQRRGNKAVSRSPGSGGDSAPGRHLRRPAVLVCL